jgi:membrane protein YdbS with pleckstrin-like domain
MTNISYDAKPAWRAYWLSILLGIATLILTIGVLIIMWAVLDRRGKRYTVDEQKAEVHQGIFIKTVESIQLEDLHKVELTQTKKQKILGIGTLVLSASEESGEEIVFQDISKPAVLKKQLEQFLD